MRRSLPHLLLLGLFVGACQADPAAPGPDPLPADTDFPVSLTTTTAVVPPGAHLIFQAVNNSATQLGYNLCMHGALEYLQGITWVGPARNTNPCPAYLVIFSAGAVNTLQYEVSPTAAAGTYRLRVQFVSMYGNEPIVRRSNTFSVQ